MTRGTGRTTKQILEAPQNAIFVWCNEETFYARAIAGSLCRYDLTILPPDTKRVDLLTRGSNRQVVIHHVAKEFEHPTPEYLHEIREIEAIARRQESLKGQIPDQEPAKDDIKLTSGYYWAKWVAATHIPDEDTYEADDFTDLDKWEIVQVTCAGGTPGCGMNADVLVCGVREGQYADGFVWGPRVANLGGPS